MKAKKPTTPIYTLRATEKYHAKFDRITISLPKGSKEWIAENTGKSVNALICELYEDYKARWDAEHGAGSTAE